MTKIAYLECPTGIAGDMCLGAIVDAGVPLNYLVEALARLGVSGEYQLWAEDVHRNGQRATKVHVDLFSPTRSRSQEGISAPIAPTAYHLSDPPAYFATEADSLAHPQEGHFHPHSDPHHPHPHSSGTHQHAPHTNSDLPNHGSSRHLPEIEQLILEAGFPKRTEAWSLAVFRRLAEAEAAVHGIPPEKVHFHEVGAVDAIVDIVGICLGLDWLGVERIYCSPLPTGGGTVWAAHGRLPVPAPAVLKLFELVQLPIYHNGIERELVTPTGAAIATTLAVQFGPPPTMTLLRVGLGAGAIDLPIPNILRLWIGERKAEGKGQRAEGRSQESGTRRQKLEDNTQHSAVSTQHLTSIQNSKFKIQNSLSTQHLDSTQNLELKTQNLELKTPFPTPYSLEETIVVLETQIDDLNPQAIGYLYDELFAVGALDVFTQAIAMKKSRPGILLTVLCHLEAVPACETTIFRETTTLGIRRSTQHRQILPRQLQPVQTEYGTIRVKVAGAGTDKPVNVQPEYEDCAQIARQHNLPWIEVHRLALAAWHRVRDEG
ncbi:nickel pincer cofactor biosynthesis protein LarC [Kovacikia minuta CCNUW1]|uniref:nickel pincer cofactor biosynthesis protein LarC n=1 Tax=Kovacikia minuta TaxID=2931930 RepID=UPI001CCB8165|nr:nickel pincer cofactor biosynthesis protein LarC [Kovacikia minuta]UBF24650.1 nickel pincer cofactor biosynthesis protein LarC [Kovacikia minuta CCNUW1]